MASSIFIRKNIFYSTLFVALFILGGCSNNFMNPQTSSTFPPLEDTGGEMPLAANIEGYNDIELPIEMKSEKNMAIRTNSFKGGIHEYSGKFDIISLKEYIIGSMVNKKWKLVGEAHYDKVMLAFLKPNKTCMVVLHNSLGGTYGKTYVSYYITVDVAAASKLNPFGEPATEQ